jgi:hypothetical protein
MYCSWLLMLRRKQQRWYMSREHWREWKRRGKQQLPSLRQRKQQRSGGEEQSGWFARLLAEWTIRTARELEEADRREGPGGQEGREGAGGQEGQEGREGQEGPSLCVDQYLHRQRSWRGTRKSTWSWRHMHKRRSGKKGVSTSSRPWVQ